MAVTAPHLPACAHPVATVVDTITPDVPWVSFPLPCAWPGCPHGIAAATVTITVPGYGAAVLRRRQRARDWIWSVARVEGRP